MKTVRFENETIAPSKIVCVGRNYVEHIYELGNEMPEDMVIFNKPNSALSDTLRYFGEATRFEGEICFIVKEGRMAGVGFGLDLTHADIQNRLKAEGLPWERAKAFDGSAVMGDFVAYEGDFSALHMKVYKNDRLVQEGGYEQMIYKPETILKEVTSFMSLEEGDIVMSGTPAGVGNYAIGDRFRGEIYADKRLLTASEWTVKS
jgi:2-keto-4-pentenoate hydratase/2-oxohepta-3-ene-1,7-dioic acid hydratase in catechol pathway